MASAMDFCVLVALLSSCSLLHVESSPVRREPRSTEQDMKMLLTKLKHSLELKKEEQEVWKQMEEEIIEDRQDNRRRCSRDTRFTLEHEGDERHKYEFEMCLDSWIACLRPNRNIPLACVHEEAGSCSNIIWRVSWVQNYTLTVCIEGDEMCMLESPLVPCMDRNNGNGRPDQQRQKAKTESFVLCHENKEGSEECVINYKDLNSNHVTLNRIDPESVCVCMEKTPGSRMCSPRACDTFSKP